MRASYGNLGNVYRMHGDLDQAVEHIEKALAIETELGRKEGMAADYGNLGIVYKIRGELGRAREYWKQSVALYSEMGVPHMVEKVQGWLDALDD